MKQHLKPGPYRAILFDIDNTLYRDDRYAQHQIDVLIARWAAEQGISIDDAERIVEETRVSITGRTGRRPSLGNTFVELGVTIPTSVVWRAQLIEPHRFLQPDPAAAAMIARLADRYRLAALTNNPVEVGRAGLVALGLDDLIPVVVGLDTTWRSKPDWEPFAAALTAVGCAPSETVMVGDRYDVDLAPMVERGGSALLVESRSDLLAVEDTIKAATVDSGGGGAVPAGRPAVPAEDEAAADAEAGDAEGVHRGRGRNE